jgi:two-component system NarL family response regulator
MGKIRILLADDHTLFREGLAGIISGQPDMEVIGEAADGVEAVVKALELKPDIILMDIRMPGLDGLEATAQISRELPSAAIIMLTLRDEPDKLFAAIKNGARGYLLKNIHSKEMIAAIRGVAQGEAPITPSIAVHMLAEFRRLSSNATEATSATEMNTLTDRESDVLAQAASGKSDKEIADTLSLSIHTVKTHMRNILSKLHASNRRVAAQIAKKKGWL